jgi:hypothetical protein
LRLNNSANLQLANRDRDVDAMRRKTLLGGTAFVGLTTSGLLAYLRGDESRAASSSGPGNAIVSGMASRAGYDGVLSVSGGAFVNGSGQALQLRGANAQGGFPFLMYPSSNRGNATDASGGIECGCDQPNGCNTTYLAKWKFNCVRIGMNTANILSKPVYDSSGTVIVPSTNAWLSQLVTYVSQLNAIGTYVSLVMAWDNPGNSAPFGQDYMATQDNAIQAWQVITGLFGYPNGTALKKNGGTVDNKSVVFELYNEPEGVSDALVYQGGFANLPYHCYGSSAETTVYPYPCGTPSGGSGSGQYFKPGENFTSSSGATGQIHCYYENTTTGFAASGSKFIHLRNGNSVISIPSGTTIRGSSSGATVTTTSSTFGWYSAGYYQMLSAIRAAGAQNVCLIGGGGWCQDIGNFQTYAQPDPEPAGYSGAGWESPQYGASWHPYPPYTWVSSAAVANGGSGYKVNDTILLPMDESGDANSGNCYWQGQLRVTGVSGSAVNAVAPVNTYRVGIPGGINGQGNSGQFNFSYGAGIWAPTFCNVLPANPVPQYSGLGGQPGTSGSGATFNLSWGTNSGFPMKTNWPTVVAIKNAGYPVCITETGEHTGTGIAGSPYMASLTSWCDANGIGLVAYTYTPSAGWYDPQGYDFSLVLTSLSGSSPNQYRTPSPGYGQFMFKWFTNHSL